MLKAWTANRQNHAFEKSDCLKLIIQYNIVSGLCVLSLYSEDFKCPDYELTREADKEIAGETHKYNCE